jgi:biotin carboxyl carrier protein
MQYQFRIGGQEFSVEVAEQKTGSLRVSVNGTPYDVMIQGNAAAAPRAAAAEPIRGSSEDRAMTAAPAAESAPAPAAVEGTVLAPIPGLILEIKVRVGETVQVGQTVAVMEAMKMENNLTTQISGVVKEVLVQKGSQVATGDVILRIV